MDKKVRVRFAPSPTGMLHLGGVRTALYDYLVAKSMGGQFILRIEDTDQTRYVEGSVENLIQSLQKLGIQFDEGPVIGGNYGPYFQSERLPIYHKYVDELIEKGVAYYCFCSKEELDEMRQYQQENNLTTKYNGKCRNLSQEEVSDKLAQGLPYVVRLKMPENRSFAIEDYIRGHVEIDSSLIDDQVILKSDKFPTYHLAAVIDDHLMEITHVLRGEEWLPSTPKHIFIYENLGWTPPIWVHLPLLLNVDRSKLSKRHGDFSVDNYLKMGYLKEAIVNFVALLGWHSAEDRELYTLDELTNEFSLERVNKAGAIFDITKLDWMNGMYMRSLDLNYIADEAEKYFLAEGFDISDKAKYLKVVEDSRGRFSTLPQMMEHARKYYYELEISDDDLVVLQKDSSKAIMRWYLDLLSHNTSLTKEEMADQVKKGMSDLGIKGKDYYAPLRIALFGTAHGPDIPTLIDTLGIDKTLQRLQKALEA